MNISSFLATAAASLALLMSASTTPQLAPHCVNIDRYLSYGSSGGDVVKLQQFLGVKMTAYFGPSTLRVLTEWQKSVGLIVSAKSPGSGVVGPKTRAALRCKSIPTATTTSVTSQIIIPIASTSTVRVPVATQAIPVAPIQTNGGGGGGGGSVSVPSVPVFHCAPFTQPKPAAALCPTGPWQLIQDEAGCTVQWDCSDPNAVE